MKWFSVGILLLGMIGAVSALSEINVVVFPDIPNTVFTYDFIFSNSNACGVVLNVSRSITTNTVGRGNATLDISALTNPPAYLCTYRGGILVNTQSLNPNAFASGNVTASNGSAGYPAIFTSATNLASGLISANMITLSAINSSLLNTTNVGTSGQLLALNANLNQFTWANGVSSILTDAMYVNITNLQTSNASTNVRIDTINTSIVGTQTNVTALQTVRDGVYVNVTALQGAGPGVYYYQNITDLQISNASTQTRINTVNITTQNLLTTNNTIFGLILTLGQNDTNLNNSINAVNTRIDTINSTLVTVQQNITDLQTSNASTNTRINTINSSKGNASLTTNGTAGYLARITSGSNLNNSALFDNGTAISLNNTVPTQLFDVQGNANITRIYTNTLCLGGNCLPAVGNASITTNATAGYLARITNGSNINNSALFDNGTAISLNSTVPTQLFDVQGNANITRIYTTSLCLRGMCYNHTLGNISSMNGTAGWPAVFTNSTNINASLITSEMVSLHTLNSTTINTTTNGTVRGQRLTLGANFGQFEWRDPVNITIITATGATNWNKPIGANFTAVFICGGGGSGGGGSTANQNQVRSGGGGGGGAMCVTKTFNIADLTDPVVVTIGAGGAAVAAAIDGSFGASSTFGGPITAFGGGGGAANAAGAGGGGGGGCATRGTSATTNTGATGGACMIAAVAANTASVHGGGAGGGTAGVGVVTGPMAWLAGAGGGTAATTGLVNGGAGGGSQYSAAGGGGGGGVDGATPGTVRDGGAGGDSGAEVIAAGGGGTAGTGAGACGGVGDGQVGATGYFGVGGKGGGGGGSKSALATNGCTGGAGGAFGGGGGGGGGGTNAGVGGAGAKGGDGGAIIISW